MTILATISFHTLWRLGKDNPRVGELGKYGIREVEGVAIDTSSPPNEDEGVEIVFDGLGTFKVPRHETKLKLIAH